MAAPIKTATVVTASDIESAKSKLSEKKIDGLKEQLLSSFGDSATVITESYVENRSDPNPKCSGRRRSDWSCNSEIDNYRQRIGY